MLTSSQIKQMNPEVLENISNRTIRRVLLEDLKMKSYKVATKLYLTDQQKRNRIQMAKNHLNCTMQQWQSCLFTDESTFEIQITGGGHRVRRKKGTSNRYVEKNTRKKCKLAFLKKNETMNSSRYIRILQKNLPTEFKKNNATIFIQDELLLTVKSQRYHKNLLWQYDNKTS